MDRVVGGLEAALEAYRADYTRYYESCKRDNSPKMRDPNPVIFLIPGVGMLSFARDKATARIAGEFYVNAINVMRGASAVSEYQGLPEQEAFDIEYWLLEEAKLQRMPKPKSLAGRIALITGGAGGIGYATAERLAGEGACVVLADIDAGSLKSAHDNLSKRFGSDQVRNVELNVTDEKAVISAFTEASVELSGIDILVSNAGIASSAPVEATELSMWNRNIDILATGYFLVSREAFRLFRRQKISGNVVFVASKTVLPRHPVHPPIARRRLPKFIWRVVWRLKARRLVSGLMSSILMPSCAARKSGTESGVSNVRHPPRSTLPNLKSITASAHC